LFSNDDETPEGTRIDLGDDLLERTIAISRASQQVSLSPEEKLNEQLQTAEILIGEGLLEEAKKILRKIVINDPHHVSAREKLERIHEIELKQIFGEERRQKPREKSEIELENINPSSVMKRLDEDLALSVLTEENQGAGISSQLSLFGDQKTLEDFAQKLDRELAGTSPRDRMDIGIAFFEMTLYELAIRQFSAARRNSDYQIPATALLAHALIASGRAFEATLALEPVINDTELDKEIKVDFLYLMGRAYEALGKKENALFWYQQVHELDSYYRDVSDRMRFLRIDA